MTNYSCTPTIQGLPVTIDDTTYEIEFGQVEIEITGRCNLRCEHCRASHNLSNRDMPIEQIVKIMRFARRFSGDYKEVVVSGGEPTLHPRFSDVLKALRDNGAKWVTLTTNGTAFKPYYFNVIEELDFTRFIFSVSVDSINHQEHDAFRKLQGSHAKALETLRAIAERNIVSVTPSMRCTIRGRQIDTMPALVELAVSCGCTRVSFSSIHPSGRAMERPDLWMTTDEKKRFMEMLFVLQKQYHPNVNVTTNDPLKCLLHCNHDVGENDMLVFDGCGAGITTFNVEVSGNMTPCALLPSNISIMNITDLTIDEMVEKYQASDFVKRMLLMDIGGKCKTCKLKYQCGGCRARALVVNNDVFAEDPHCFA